VQKLLSVLRGNELRHLRREEAGELTTLALDGVDQPRIGDRDRRLLGKELDKLDVVLGERSWSDPYDSDHADQLVLEQDRDAQGRAIGTRPRIGVLRIL